MANCRYCATDCPERGEHDRFFNCALYTERKPTNADRIRNMSDEELAAIFVAESLAEKIPFCQNKAECNEILDTANGTIPEEMCLKCALDWLCQPAKEATHE